MKGKRAKKSGTAATQTGLLIGKQHPETDKTGFTALKMLRFNHVEVLLRFESSPLQTL